MPTPEKLPEMMPSSVGVSQDGHLQSAVSSILWLACQSKQFDLGESRSSQKQTVKHPKLKSEDGIFWVWLSQMSPEWKLAMIVVKAEAVIRRHPRASNGTGVGNHGPARLDDQESAKKSAISSPSWPKATIWSSEILAFPNFANVHQEEHKTQKLWSEFGSLPNEQ